jgi:hypothetical protein
MATQLLQATGKLSMLRVHDVGTGWGPPSDHLDVEVVIQFHGNTTNAYGFQLRQDSNEPARQGMLSLLRDAFTNQYTVTVDYDIDTGKVNGTVVRVWLTR